MSNKLSGWPRFVHLAFRRLKQGALEYGDQSFSKPVPVLIQEIREELLDFVNWGYILHQRLEDLERAYERSAISAYERDLEESGEEGG